MILVLLISKGVTIFIYYSQYSLKKMQVLKSIENFGQISESGQLTTDAWAAGQRLVGAFS